MNALRKKRLYGALAILVGVAVAVALALGALRQNINLFYSPSQIRAGEAPRDANVRAGGLVEKGSVQRAADSLLISFVVTDGAAELTVHYQGILPDLFREGHGIVAQGRLTPDGVLVADEVLAKHDEKYTPPEVKQALVQNVRTAVNADRPRQEAAR